VDREILCVMLGVIGLSVTVYLYRLPTYEESEESEDL